MTHNQLYNIYIASCSPDGGIYHYTLFPDGHMEFVNKTNLDRPMYTTVDKNKMYILLRAPFTKNRESALVVYDIDENGLLVNPSPLASTRGEVACHLTVKDSDVYCVNYISGSVIKIPDTLVTHEGKGPHPQRQASPHTHYVGFTPDKKYICVTDLGLDTIFIYNPDMTIKCKASVPKGHGARHLIFSEDGDFCFVANELLSTVSSFRYCDGTLSLIETVDVLLSDYKGESTASAIRYNDGKIYVSNRGHNSISVLEHMDGRMNLLGTIDCGGDFPRDFDIVGDFIISTNEKSNSVTVINKQTLKEVYKVTGIDSPICIIYR